MHRNILLLSYIHRMIDGASIKSDFHYRLMQKKPPQNEINILLIT